MHGALDTGAGANWVRYLGPGERGETVNIAATCGSLGELITIQESAKCQLSIEN